MLGAAGIATIRPLLREQQEPPARKPHGEHVVLAVLVSVLGLRARERGHKNRMFLLAKPPGLREPDLAGHLRYIEP